MRPFGKTSARLKITRAKLAETAGFLRGLGLFAHATAQVVRCAFGEEALLVRKKQGVKVGAASKARGRKGLVWKRVLNLNWKEVFV